MNNTFNIIIRTAIKLFIFAIVLFQLSCDRVCEQCSDAPVVGVWVHTETKTDTMDFNIHIVEFENTFELRREKEVRDGHFRPGHGQGPYWYRIEGDSIYLKWWASSYSGSFAYYFKMEEDGNSFLIGNFAPFGGLLVNRFERIK